jgi:glycosyltransferase involved in cell wall biosynthesis
MKVHLLIQSTRFTGGRQVLLDHAGALFRCGHQVKVWAGGGARVDWMEVEPPVEPLPGRSLAGLPPADICLFERASFARPVRKARRGVPVHFCQGCPWTDLENRLSAVLRQRGRIRGLPELVRLRRRLVGLDRAYRMDTEKIAVHPPLRDMLEARYGQRSHLVPNGLPPGLFSPPASRDFTGRTVLLVGSADTPSKHVEDSLHSLRILKRVGRPVRLLRASPHPMSEAERKLGLSDEYHVMLRRESMAELYRRADVLLSGCDATEGFGLPCLEAMASGTPLLVTDIPAFRAFALPIDYAHFVPVGKPAAMAHALGSLLENPAERARLSRRGLEVAAAYTLERSHLAMAEALVEIMSRRGGAGGPEDLD